MPFQHGQRWEARELATLNRLRDRFASIGNGTVWRTGVDFRETYLAWLAGGMDHRAGHGWWADGLVRSRTNSLRERPQPKGLDSDVTTGTAAPRE